MTDKNGREDLPQEIQELLSILGDMGKRKMAKEQRFVDESTQEDIDEVFNKITRVAEGQTDGGVITLLSLRRALFHPVTNWMKAERPNPEDLIAALNDMAALLVSLGIASLRSVDGAKEPPLEVKKALVYSCLASVTMKLGAVSLPGVSEHEVVEGVISVLRAVADYEERQ